MADDVLWNDDQKVEQIKKWWKQYGNYAFAALFAVALGMLAWQYWHRHELKESEQASIAYENVIGSEQMAPQTTASLAQQVKQQFSSTPYADFSAFILAKQAIAKNDYASAATELQWVVDNAHAKAIEQLARLRLARVFLAQQQPQKALTVLQNKTMNIYPGLTALIEGDAHVALGDVAAARKNYQAATLALPKQSALLPLANMKLTDLPVSN